MKTADETEFDRVRLRAALDRIAHNPGPWLMARAQQYPRLFIDSGNYMFGQDGVPLRTAVQRRWFGQVIIRIVFILGNLLVFFFALVGTMVQRVRFADLSHLVLFPLFLCAVSLPLWIEPRYGLPMMPMIAILSASGFTHILRALVRHRVILNSLDQERTFPPGNDLQAISK